MPLIAGKIPQIQNPVKPKNKSFFHSAFIYFWFFLIPLETKGNKIKKAKSHLHKAKDIGGTRPAAPLLIAT